MMDNEKKSIIKLTIQAYNNCEQYLMVNKEDLQDTMRIIKDCESDWLANKTIMRDGEKVAIQEWYEDFCECYEHELDKHDISYEYVVYDEEMSLL